VRNLARKELSKAVEDVLLDHPRCFRDSEIDPDSLPPILQQAGVDEIAQVTGSLRLGDPKDFNEVADTELAFPEQKPKH